MEKIARLCWNTNEWRRPSGRKGKSKNKSYEQEKGFGHEEWLLDDSKIMPDGYHYCFLEPLNVKSDKHYGKIYDIHLFTISPTKQRVYIGCLKNAVGVSIEDSKQVYKYYQNKGWIDEMKQDVLYVEGNPTDFEPQLMFNVKFRFEDAHINFSNQPILKAESIGHRYNLMDKKGILEFEKDETGSIKILDTSIFEQVLYAGKILIDPLHKKIQNAVAAILKKEEYIKIQVESGKDDSVKQRVDIKAYSKRDQEWHFFEVKTMSAKRSIREALGQILEYTHYPNSTLAKKMFIIGPEQPDDKDKSYIKLLREKYNIPIWFRWFSFADDKLYEGI